MSTIHCREVDGKKRYRLWSGIVDGYLTPEFTEERLAIEMLEMALAEAQEQFERTFPDRLARAQKYGTSSQLDFRQMDGPLTSWLPERTPYDGDSK